MIASHESSPDAVCAADFPDESAGKWHVLHTKSRQEKALAEDLLALGIPHFLPLVRQVRYYGKRKSLAELPIFPGYLFLRGSLDDAYQADRTRRVARLIKVNDQTKIDWELRNIYVALSKDAPLAPYPFLSKGIRVEVRSGPFRGLQGVIEDVSKRGRLILRVETLGSALSLEIDGALLDPLDGHHVPA